jgi:GAF domain-containing protein
MLDPPIIPCFQRCRDLHSIIDCTLSKSLALTGAGFGNVQLMDWRTGNLTIAGQHGFGEDFLRHFHLVSFRSGSACGRAVQERRAVIIEDVLHDREFAPFHVVAIEAGFRAVQSTPLISTSGALVGVLSTHFAHRHRPLDGEMDSIKMTAESAANEILAWRVRQRRAAGLETDQITTSLATIEESRQLLRRLNRMEHRLRTTAWMWISQG